MYKYILSTWPEKRLYFKLIILQVLAFVNRAYFWDLRCSLQSHPETKLMIINLLVVVGGNE